MPLFCSGQMFDDFSDGNFSSNPVWDGDVNNFKVNVSLQLQLDDTQENTSSLFTAIELFPSMEWRGFVRQAFSPSGNNYSRMYLAAKQFDTINPPDGVFIQLGEAGSIDAIRLMNQINGDTATLISGDPGAIASSFSLDYKVVFENNLWQLYVDYDNNANYTYEGMADGSLDAAYNSLGVFCKYTVSNSSKFYFDNFYAGPILYDTISPEIISTNALDYNLIEICFSEYVDPLSGLDPQNYALSDGLGSPEEVVFLGSEQNIILASCPDSLPYGKLLHLNVENIADQSGNIMFPATMSFAWYYPEQYDIIINEIMADPTPSQGLPEFEYLELYNACSLPINMHNWTLTIGSSEKLLSGPVLGSNEYLIVAKEDASPELSSYGLFYGLESLTLANSGQDLMLCDQEGDVIHSLSYNKDWYHDEDHAEGGWSLEMTDPYNPCLQIENWTASSHINGGTPGSENTNFDELFLSPMIVNRCVIDSLQILIVFNQSMHNNIGFLPDIFNIDGGIGDIETVMPVDPHYLSFILSPYSPLKQHKIYSLQCRGMVYNCLGDSSFFSEDLDIGIPGNIEYNDVVINEVLFNPFPGGVDYLELYNRSDKVISLGDLIIASVKNNPPSPPDTDFVAINAQCNVLLPGKYVLISENNEKVTDFYNCNYTEKSLELEKLPAYSNEKGTILLLDAYQNTVDAFSYSEDMHYPFLNYVEGISLERIHFDRPASDKTNWHSAAQLAGFGTPGYQNSQFSEQHNVGGELIIHPKVFTPGYDGISDHTTISFELDKPGFLSTIMVFNTSGQLCRHLVNNELLGTSGSYSWDGIDLQNQRVPAGIYIVLAELIHPDGDVLRLKETVIIAM